MCAARPSSSQSSLAEFERDALFWFVTDALERNRWNIRATAASIGTHRTNLYRIMARLGIERPGKDKRVGRLMTPEFRRFLGMGL